MDKAQLDQFVAEFGVQAGTKMKEYAAQIEKDLNAKHEELMKGSITKDQFEAYKTSLSAPPAKEGEQGGLLYELNKELIKVQEASKAQGTEMATILSALKETKGVPKGIQEFFGETIKMPTGAEGKVLDMMKQIQRAGQGFIEFTGAQLKAAGITSISGSVQAMTNPPTSPYLPGLNGTPLEFFEIMRNPNWITTRVDLGRTDSFRLAWVNETDYQGTPGTAVAEGGAKPLTQHKFKVELSEAKKAAAYIELTEEFEKDVPQLATIVRRLLQQDVMRAWDDQVQQDVIDAAYGYDITQLNGKIAYANYWSALRAMEGQIGFYNFTADTVAINPLTGVITDEQKSKVNGVYLLPPYLARMQDKMIEANKVAFDYALVGDLKQYKVDIYLDFVLKIGWINDNLIQNKFCIVGELRYHSYISDNRKRALVYDNIPAIVDTINDGSAS
jgi:hypothetical protein